MTLEMTRYCFTTADYDRMIGAGILDEDDRVELIEGEIVEMTPIGLRHAASVKRLIKVFGDRFSHDAQIGAQDPIHLGEASEPQPDITLLRPSPNFYASAHPAAGDIFLLVEVSDSSVVIDRQIKVPLYARYGVSEVWLVDLVDDVIEVYCDPTPSGYSTVRVVKRGESLGVRAFPGREIAVADILG